MQIGCYQVPSVSHECTTPRHSVPRHRNRQEEHAWRADFVLLSFDRVTLAVVGN